MSYLEFYNLEQEPFSNAPVAKFYFDSNQHEQALIRLKRVASEMKGLAILSGDIGAGKTTLARKMLDSLPENEFEAALLVIIHSGITAQWLLRRIAQQLGVNNPAEEKLQILSQLYRRLLQIADQGKKAVVLIDEAQMLQTKELMEEFRGLLNLEVPEKKLVTFIFFGLPEMEDHLRLDPPLHQRIAMRWRLDALDSASCQKYIEHRMKLAGSKKKVFTKEAIQAIFQYSHGIPRLINTIADNALFEGFILKSSTISKEIVENIVGDLGLGEFKKREFQNLDEEVERAVEDISVVSFADATPEKTAEQKFERENPDENEDIEDILSGLEEKL
jgi:type II secretory pathway predicted ATPase ExeA